MSAKIVLRWDNNNEIEKGYRVYRDDVSFDENNYPQTPIAILDENVTEYEDNDVVNGNTYYYVVSAYTDDEELYSEIVSVEARDIENTIVTIGESELNHRSIDDGSLINSKTFPNAFNNFCTVRKLSDNNIAVINGTSVFVLDITLNEIWSSDLGNDVRGLDVDSDDIIYVLSYSRVYKFDRFGNELYNLSVDSDEFGARGITVDFDGEYWAHTNGEGSQRTYVRNKSNNELQYNYDVADSLVSTLYIKGDIMYSGHTGNGREINRVNIPNSTMDSYWSSTSNPIAYSFLVYEDSNMNEKLMFTTNDPGLYVADTPFTNPTSIQTLEFTPLNSIVKKR